VRPLVLLCASPRSREDLFDPMAWAVLTEEFEVVEYTLPADASFDEVLPRAFAVVGQPRLTAQRLQRAESLRVIANVEGNFLPNVDYDAALSRGIHVLSCGPAYAQPVAEYALALALDLGRGITRADRDFRAGVERYTVDGNADSILLRHADVGLLGFGGIARALLPLLRPFAPRLRAYDPWLPDGLLREAEVEPVPLEELLRRSTYVFVLATVTEQSTHLLDAARLDLLPPRARLVVVSRAAIVDFTALYERVRAGRLLAAVDVWPQEPVALDDEARSLDGMVLSAHRAGGIASAFRLIGDMVLDDLRLVASGLPPVRLQRAERELVRRYRNRPVEA